MIASFAGKQFSTSRDKLYIPQEFEYTPGALRTEKQEAEGSIPATYIKGMDLGSLSIELRLSAEHGVNPRKEIDAWQVIVEQGQPHKFILGAAPLGKYQWLLTGAAPTDVKLTNDGGILSCLLSLAFAEYAREGTAKSAAGGAAQSSSRYGEIKFKNDAKPDGANWLNTNKAANKRSGTGVML